MVERERTNHLSELAKLLPYLSLIAVSLLAFNREQRAYIHERDERFGITTGKGGCQFPESHRCNGDDATQIHHIIPQRYAKELGIDPDFVENGITLCEYSHQNLIHPDMRSARSKYGGNKESYKEAFQQRAQQLAKRMVYWTTTWDRQLHTTIVRSEQRARKAGFNQPEGKP